MAITEPAASRSVYVTSRECVIASEGVCAHANMGPAARKTVKPHPYIKLSCQLTVSLLTTNLTEDVFLQTKLQSS